MPASTAQLVRTYVRDIPQQKELTRYGDGTALVYSLAPDTNISSGTAYVPLGGTAWSATGATFDVSGTVTFANVISANSAFRVVYVQSVFSEAEIGEFITAGGSIKGAAMEALIAMMFDATRAARWGAADGSYMDTTSTQSHLRQLYDKLQQELEQEATTFGGINSWSVNQQNW